jgi:Second Messenger Oligonucleotide or Dinucleotide Synthetase domain
MIQTLRLDAEFLTARDSILEGICRKLQLSKTQHDLAVSHYHSAGDWLNGAGSKLNHFQPYIYSQGSLPMGTTNKPLTQDEYDLDAVCELNINWLDVDPDLLAKAVAERLEEHGDYKKRIKLKPRCVRLTYAHDFHLDIVPACKNAELGEGQIRLPDGRGGWKDSNSRQFIKWFGERANLYRNKARATCDFAEPVPAQQSLEEKSPLQCAVQLIKRSRDIFFRKNSELAPASIVLSTLCAQVYQGEESVFDTVTICLAAIAKLIEKSLPYRLVVMNPANKAEEDLGEKWDDLEAYKEFATWIFNFQLSWNEFKNMQGIPKSSNILKQLFGEQPTQAVIAEFAESLNQSRENGILRMKPTGLLTTQAGIVLPKNTFYGT